MCHVETDVFALAVFIIMLIKNHLYRKNNHDLQGKAFYLVLIFSIISNVIDIISSVAMSNPFTELFFHLTKDMKYSRGIFFMPVGVGFIMLYSAIGLLLVLIHRKQKLPHTQKQSFSPA